MVLFPESEEALWNDPVAREYLQNAIRTESRLCEIVEELRDEKRTIVWTNGVFDMLHLGHKCLLQNAANYGDALIVSVNSNTSVSLYKPKKGGTKRPFQGENSRIVSVSSVKGVDYVALFDEKSPMLHIQIIKPDYWIRADTFRAEHNGVSMEEFEEGKEVLKYGGKCLEVPFLPPYSTTTNADRLMNLGKEQLREAYTNCKNQYCG